MKKMIFLITLVVLSNIASTVFSMNAANQAHNDEWIGLKEIFLKPNKNDQDKYQDQCIDKENIKNTSRFGKKYSKRSLSTERLEDKKRTLSLEQRRRRKSIQQNEIVLNHREAVAFMMICSQEKHN